MTPDITHDLFIAYVRGTASRAEAANVRGWLAQPANQLLAQGWMRQHWEEMAAASLLPAAAEEPDYEALLASLRPHLAPAARPQPLELPARPVWRRWAMAATVAGALLGGSGWWLATHQPATPLAVRTAYGQTRTVRLPDGSSVTLNGHSSLRYPAAWATGKPREVWLDGEAYFAVQHKEDNQHFIVHTQAGFNVEVLGTQFTVYRRHDQGRVVLLSGKVRVNFDNPKQPDVLLKPGELVETREVRPTQPVVTTYKAVRTAPYASWKDTRLVLDETTVADLATRLQDTYGLQVVVATPGLAERKVTGTVPLRDLDALLQALEETFHLQITRTADRIILADKN